MSQEKLIEIKNLKTFFNTEAGIARAVNDVSFDIYKGEVLGIVGESGSGKSVTSMSINRLIPNPPGEIVGGEIFYKGKDLLKYSYEQMSEIRGKEISMIFQEPMTSLNPVLRISSQMNEILVKHEGLIEEEATKKSIEMLKRVGIPEPERRIYDYPHQFSGGMRQRVMIAIALACDPKVLIADEPTTALDVTIQAQILDIVKRLRKELGMAIIWITHDLGVVAGIADRVAVMYGGFIVEQAPVKKLYSTPKHPYTQGLLSTLPKLEGERTERLESIKGQPPDLHNIPDSCPFAPRCIHVSEKCQNENPRLEMTDPEHQVACWWNTEKENYSS